MNLLSVSAAYGVMTLAAKGGGLSTAIGIDHRSVAPFMPVMMSRSSSVSPWTTSLLISRIQRV